MNNFIALFQLIKAVADIVELSRTEVGFAVEAKQCDAIFAVYNILLQEELKTTRNSAPKAMSAVVIRDHSSITRLAGATAEKRRKVSENAENCSRNVSLQKNRLRSTQAKRHFCDAQKSDAEFRKVRTSLFIQRNHFIIAIQRFD